MHVSGDLVHQLDIITVLVNNSSRLAIGNQPIRVQTKNSTAILLKHHKLLLETGKNASFFPLGIG